MSKPVTVAEAEEFLAIFQGIKESDGYHVVVYREANGDLDWVVMPENTSDHAIAKARRLGGVAFERVVTYRYKPVLG